MVAEWLLWHQGGGNTVSFAVIPVPFIRQLKIIFMLLSSLHLLHGSILASIFNRSGKEFGGR